MYTSTLSGFVLFLNELMCLPLQILFQLSNLLRALPFKYSF